MIAFFVTIKRRSIRTTDERLAWAIVLGTIPGVIVGAAFENVIQDTLGAPWLIAIALAVFGVLLWAVDRRARSDRSLDDLRPRSGLMLGVAQAVALQPGVSRSGVTITAARAMGFDRETAARFSFLLALPIIAGAGLYKALDLAKTGVPEGMMAPFVWGFFASAVSGFLTIWFLLKYLRRHDFTLFMVYRLVLAAIVLIAIATGFRPPTV